MTSAHLFVPRHLAMPLDVTLAAEMGGDSEMLAWITARLALRDPGPLHLEEGEYFTPMSVAELGALDDGEAAHSIFWAEIARRKNAATAATGHDKGCHCA